jgi:S-adenosylmethionine hydrolase
VIVLLTDFGLEGPYTGQVEAVLYAQAPGVPVVSLFADLAPCDVRSAAYLLPAYTAGFPTGSVFLCVVDPGVGGERPGVAVHADGRWYVGPDEGLFEPLRRRMLVTAAWTLPVPGTAAPSFHGRDVFAPVAAFLARNGRLPEGCADHALVARPDWPDDLTRVVYVDRFGNAVTGLRASALAATARLRVADREIARARTFSDVAEGEPFWYANANRLVEIAVNRGRADALLDLQVGQAVEIVTQGA